VALALSLRNVVRPARPWLTAAGCLPAQPAPAAAWRRSRPGAASCRRRSTRGWRRSRPRPAAAGSGRSCRRDCPSARRRRTRGPAAPAWRRCRSGLRAGGGAERGASGQGNADASEFAPTFVEQVEVPGVARQQLVAGAPREVQMGRLSALAAVVAVDDSGEPAGVKAQPLPEAKLLASRLAAALAALDCAAGVCDTVGSHSSVRGPCRVRGTFQLMAAAQRHRSPAERARDSRVELASTVHLMHP
jgi:hypothetical protein